MPSTRTLDFYFDFLSPFAYFAWKQVEPFCQAHGLTLNIKPVVFGKLLDHWGQLGPAEIAPKQRWMAEYCLRYAAQHGYPLAFPKYHPFNSLSALRLSLQAVSGPLQTQVVETIFHAGWGEGQDIGDLSVIEESLLKAGLDPAPLVAQISTLEVKQLLKTETAEAVNQGVFGVPSMVIEGQLFWGNDQFEYLELFVQGKDPLDHIQLNKLINKQRAIDRKAVSNKSK